MGGSILTWLTLAAILWLLGYFALGYRHGFWRAASGLLSLLTAYFASVTLAEPLANMVVGPFGLAQFRWVVLVAGCAMLLFVCVGIAVRMAIGALSRSTPELPPVADRILGVACSGLNGVLVAIPLIWAVAFYLEVYALKNPGTMAYDAGQEPPQVVQWSRRVMAQVIAWNLKQSTAGEPAAALSAAFAVRPTAVLTQVKQTMGSAEFRQLVRDPEVLAAVNSNDVTGLRRSAAYRDLLANAEIKKLHQLAFNSQTMDEQRLAEHLMGIWRNLQQVQNHPGMAALLKDQEVQDFLAGSGQVTPSILEKAQIFLTLWSRQRDEQSNLPAADMAGIYRWVDAEGQLHYSDYEDIPQRYQEIAEPLMPGD